MTIEELQKDKSKLEEDINTLVYNFIKKHELNITDFEINNIFYRTTDGKIQSITTNVDITI